MALIGIQIDRTNPTFTKADFVFWMPQFTGFMNGPDGDTYFSKIYTLINGKIFKSIYGSDWELAMSYAMAHYLTLVGQNMQTTSGSSLNEVHGGHTVGVMSSASIGSFSKNYDLDKTMLDNDEDKFWNQTPYGSALMALLRTKPVPSIMVVTSNPLEGAN